MHNSSPRRKAKTFVVTALLALAWGAPANAEIVVVKIRDAEKTEANFQRAKNSTADSKKAFTEGDIDGALAHANGAYKAYPNASTAFFVANVYAHSGNVRKGFEWALRARNHDPAEAMVGKIDKVLAKWGEEVSLGVLSVTVAPTTATVTLDGRTVVPGSYVGASPGELAVAASAANHRPLQRRVTVVAGRDQTVVLSLEALPTVEPATTESTGGVSAAGLGLIIGGVVAAGAGVGLHVWGASQDSAADDMTGNWAAGVTYEESLAQYDGLRGDGEVGSYVAYGLYGLGAALIIAGAVVWALDDGPQQGQGSVKVGAGPLVGPGSVGAVISGGF